MLPVRLPGSDPPAPSPPAILIVDDSTRYRTQMQRMVSKSCPWARIYEAADILGALRLVRDIGPRLIFVDVVLGDESGIDCTRQIFDLAPATCIVLISAYPDHEFRRAGAQVGALTFLDKKDLNAATLAGVIAELLGGIP